jgi:XTP/dITP diphosphohydrolase
MARLLLASNNPGKAAEYRRLLARLPYELVTPADIGLDISVAESGSTFEENAALKATIYASLSGLLTIADDSGLEVDALGGEPGVYSARYGNKSSDAERNEYLLENLKGVPPEKRQARFRCVIALASHMGLIGTVSGECEGVITSEPKGENGFGYDPVFFISELGRTMAELPMKEKNRLSHRARAAAKLKVLLKRNK